ncbi:MAG: invasion associated locus B family protein [Ancalomicrobiaceae bacterium]|nr:invasion associated locus B family protein [Ancalomicrobiaceae bacterium]
MRELRMRRLVSGLVAVCVLVAPALAQTKAAPKAPMEKPAEIKQPASNPSPPPAPIRTETFNFDSWTVSCQEFAEPKPKKTCVAQIRVTQSQNGQVVLLWTIGHRDDGQLESLLRIPTGVAIRPGIDLKVDSGAVRKLDYAVCEPTFCTATSTLDAAEVKELVGAEAIHFVVYGSNGNNLKLDLPVKGTDKALAALKR